MAFEPRRGAGGVAQGEALRALGKRDVPRSSPGGAMEAVASSSVAPPGLDPSAAGVPGLAKPRPGLHLAPLRGLSRQLSARLILEKRSARQKPTCLPRRSAQSWPLASNLPRARKPIMPHSYTQLLYHIVYSTKERRPWLKGIRGRVHAYLGGGIRDEGGTALCVGGVDDHVHILARLRQDKAISAVIGAIKANSSGWIHREFSELAEFEWQVGYAAFTVSKSQEGHLRRYIDGQEEHHRTRSFQEELILLLKAHGIKYDERYLWT